MAGPLALPLILGGASLLSGGVNAGVQLHQGKKQREYGREMADLTWERDQQMWNQMNEYNHPQQQLNRLKDAGLNPALMYGKQGTTGTASSMPNYKTPQGNFPAPQFDLNSKLGQYFDIRNKQAQHNLMHKQTENIEQDIMLKGLEGIGKGYKNIILQNQSLLSPRTLNYQTAMYGENLRQKARQIALIDTNREKVQQQVNWLDLKFRRMAQQQINIDKDPFTARTILDFIFNPKRYKDIIPPPKEW